MSQQSHFEQAIQQALSDVRELRLKYETVLQLVREYQELLKNAPEEGFTVFNWAEKRDKINGRADALFAADAQFSLGQLSQEQHESAI